MSTISITKPSPEPSQITNIHHPQQLISAYIRLNTKKAYLIKISPKITLSQLYKLVGNHLKLQPEQIVIITKGRILKEDYLPIYGTKSFIFKEKSITERNDSVQNSKNLSIENNGVLFPQIQLFVEDKQIFHAVLYQNVYQPRSLRLLIKQLIKLEDTNEQIENSLSQNKSNNLSNNSSGNSLNLNNKDFNRSIYSNTSFYSQGVRNGPSKPLIHLWEIQGINKEIQIKVLINEVLGQMQVPLINNQMISSYIEKYSQQNHLVELPPYIEFGVLRQIIRDEAVLVYTGRVLASNSTLEEEFVEDNAELIVTFRKPLIVKSLVRYYGLIQQKRIEQSMHIQIAEDQQVRLQVGNVKNQESVRQNNRQKEQVFLQKRVQQVDINLTFSPYKTQTTEQEKPLQINLQTANNQSINLTEKPSIDHLQKTKKQHKLQNENRQKKNVQIQEQYYVGKVEITTQQEHYDSNESHGQMIQLENENKQSVNSQQLTFPYILKQKYHPIQPTKQNKRNKQGPEEKDKNIPQAQREQFSQSFIYIRKIPQHINSQTNISSAKVTTHIEKLINSSNAHQVDKIIDTTPIEQLVDTPINKLEDTPNDKDISLNDQDTLIDRLNQSIPDIQWLMNVSRENILAKEENNQLVNQQSISINYMSPQTLQVLSKNSISSSVEFLIDNNSINLQPINQQAQETQILMLQQNNTPVSPSHDSTQIHNKKKQKMTHFSQELVEQEKKISLQNQHSYHESHQQNTQNILQDITQLQTQKHHKIQSLYEDEHSYQYHLENQQQLQQRTKFQSSNYDLNQNEGINHQDNSEYIQKLLVLKQQQYEETKIIKEEKLYQMLSSYTKLIDGLTGQLLPYSQIQHQKYLAFRQQVDSIQTPKQVQIIHQNKLNSSIHSNVQQKASSELKLQMLQLSTEINKNLNSSRPQSLPVTPTVQLQIPKSSSQQAISFAQQSFVVSSIEMNGYIQHKKQIQNRKIHEYIQSYNGNLLDISPIHENLIEENTQINKIHQENSEAKLEKQQQNMGANLQDIQKGIQEIKIIDAEGKYPITQNKQISIEEIPIAVQIVKVQPQQELIQGLQAHPVEFQDLQQQANDHKKKQGQFEVKVYMLLSDGEGDKNEGMGEDQTPVHVMNKQQILGQASQKHKNKFLQSPSKEQHEDLRYDLREQVNQENNNQSSPIEDNLELLHKENPIEAIEQQIQKLQISPHSAQLVDPLEQALTIVDKPEPFIDEHHSLIVEPIEQVYHIVLQDMPQSILKSKPQQLHLNQLQPINLQSKSQRFASSQTFHIDQSEHIVQVSSNNNNKDSLNQIDLQQSSDASNPSTQQNQDHYSQDQHQPKVKFTEGDLLYTIELDLNPKPKLIDAIAYQYHDLLCKNLQEFVQTFGNIIPEDDPSLFHQPFSSDHQKLKFMMRL